IILERLPGDICANNLQIFGTGCLFANAYCFVDVAVEWDYSRPGIASLDHARICGKFFGSMRENKLNTLPCPAIRFCGEFVAIRLSACSVVTTAPRKDRANGGGKLRSRIAPKVFGRSKPAHIVLRTANKSVDRTCKSPD